MPTEEEGKQENESFVEFFNEATDLEKEGVAAPIEKEEPAGEDKEQVEKPAEEASEKAEKQVVNTEEETYEQRWKSLQGIHRHDKEVWEAEKTQLLAQIEAEKNAARSQKETGEELKKEAAKLVKDMSDEDLTAEQKAQLDEYEQDFETVSKMEGLKRTRELKALRREIEDFKKDVLSQLTPTQEAVKEVQADREERSRSEHFESIKRVHGDFEKFRDDGSILKWIESKPKYMQPGLLQTYQKGNSDDVIEFLTDFKKDNNILPPDKPENVINIDSKKETKKQAMSAVVTKRGAVNLKQASTDDYEGSFDEALRKSGG